VALGARDDGESEGDHRRHYGEAPRLSYWNGCSAGGKQALKEAQRFPEDFNGIVAGAPASDWTGRASSALRVAARLHKDQASNIPTAKYPAIHAAVLEACDALDGVKDGVLENPRACRFDPKVLECKRGDSPTCLTSEQVDAVRAIYASPNNPKTGRALTGLEPEPVRHGQRARAVGGAWQGAGAHRGVADT
jgi:feruloyl esterase